MQSSLEHAAVSDHLALQPHDMTAQAPTLIKSYIGFSGCCSPPVHVGLSCSALGMPSASTLKS